MDDLLVELYVALALSGSRDSPANQAAISPCDPVVFTAVAVVLLGVSLLASWVPARRAEQVEPTRALRYE